MSPNVPKNLSNIFVDLVEYRALRDVSGRRRTIAPALSDDYTCSTSTSPTTFRVRSLARDPSSSAHQSPALSRGCLYVYAGRETSVHLNHLCSRPSPYALFLRTAHTSIVYLPVLVFIPPFLLLYFYFLFFFRLWLCSCLLARWNARSWKHAFEIHTSSRKIARK